jgi:4-amino-4-deoxy-L-arabinose transferase-like glycosyltransferase
MTRTMERALRRPQLLLREEGQQPLLSAGLILGVALLALVGLVGAMQRAQPIALAPVGATFDHASVGWNSGERTKEGAAFRWTGAESTLTFRAARRALPAHRRLILTMRFSGRPPGTPVTTITLLANGVALDTWPSNVEHPVAADVTPLLQRHDELFVTIRTDETYSPPRDRRELGITLVGDAQLAAWPGKAIPSPDAAVSVVLLVLLAALVVGRRAGLRVRLIAAGAMAFIVTLGVLLARVPFWRVAMPLELTLAAVAMVRWAPVWWAALTTPLRALQRRAHLDDRALVLGGAVIALAGQVIVAQHRWMLVGAVMLAVGLVGVVAGFGPNPLAPFTTGEGRGNQRNVAARTDDLGMEALPRDETRLRRWQIVALVGIAALAVALRLTLLTEMPASLFKDEGRHALKVAQILDDPSYRPVYEPDIALPALFLYPMALAFKVFGVSLLTLRLFMATMGVIDVALLFLLARRLFGTRVGLIAAYLFAAAFWALRMQRVALAPAFSTGLVLLALLLFVRAMQVRRWGDWALAGVGASGTLYCYHSGPFTLVLIALVALVLLIRGPRRFLRFWLPRFAVLAGVFLILAAPLFRYVVTHFAQYTARPRQTAIFSEVNLQRLGQDRLAAFQANIAPNIGMYTVRGDHEPKHNLPFAPHLDAIMAVLFLAGLALLVTGWLHGPSGVARSRRFAEWLVLGYLAVMLIPSVLAIDAPNTLRAFDTLPPALLIVALAADAVWRRMAGEPHSPTPSHLPKGHPSGKGEQARWALRVVAPLMLTAMLALNVGTYFGLMRHDPTETLRFDTYFASQAGKRMAEEAEAHPGMTFFVPRETIDRDVLPFFARVMAGKGSLRPLEGADPATLPTRYAVILPNGKQETSPDDTIAALPWARGLERVPGNSPAGARGVPAFIEYRTP